MASGFQNYKIGVGREDSMVIFNSANLTFGELSKCILKNNWSPGVFRDNYRKLDNFISADVIGLDIDEGMGIEQCKLVLDSAGMKYVIAPSKSHQKPKPKKGVEVVCDRFRVILFLSETCTNSAQLKATIKHVCKELSITGDKQAMEAARYFAPSTSIYASRIFGKTIDLVAPESLKQVKREPFVIAESFALQNLTAASKEFLATGGQDGQRNKAILHVAANLKGEGSELEGALALVEAALNLSCDRAKVEQHLKTFKYAWDHYDGFRKPQKSQSTMEKINHLIEKYKNGRSKFIGKVG
ncbi:hypothetical protein [Bdellovibrio sp. HCB209]|uniref:hypothetical protein n=1 Tax=Bdellovibrio sp. HCB209 TaxID=3394354 RepID=UPI0039B4817E